MTPEYFNAQSVRLLTLGEQRRWVEVATVAREWLAERRHFIPHLFLINALLQQDLRADAAREFRSLASYKFNLRDKLDHFPAVKFAFAAMLMDNGISNTMRDGESFEGIPLDSSPNPNEAGRSVRWKIPAMVESRTAYLEMVDRELFETLRPVNRMQRSQGRVVTFGSCFAANLARLLKARDMDAHCLLIEESVNSTFANALMLEVIAGDTDSARAVELTAALGEEVFSTIRAKLAIATHIVLTVGVGPAFFRIDSGRFVFATNYGEQLKTGAIRMRSTTVDENKRNLERIVELLEVVAPHAAKVITVSPVPLGATAEMASAVIADAVSKSTLRAAVHEVVAVTPRLTYFPAFEAVRWLSGYTTADVYGADDQNSRHVSDWLVAHIVDRFIDQHFSG